MKFKIIILILIFTVLFGGFLNFVSAEKDTLIIESGIPGQLDPGIASSKNITPEKYITFLYLFMIGLVGIAGFASLVWYGIVWIYSGISEKKSEAMEGIKNTLIGIGLALGSFVILNTINPALVTLENPKIPKVPLKSEGEMPKEITRGAYIEGLLLDKANAKKAFNLVDNELGRLLEKEKSVGGLSEVEIARKKSLELKREKLKLELESVQNDITALKENLSEDIRCQQKYRLETLWCGGNGHRTENRSLCGDNIPVWDVSICCAYRASRCDNTLPGS